MPAFPLFLVKPIMTHQQKRFDYKWNRSRGRKNWDNATGVRGISRAKSPAKIITCMEKGLLSYQENSKSSLSCTLYKICWHAP